MRNRDINFVGKTFNRLKVESFTGVKNRARYWLCVCVCGNKVEVDSRSLSKGRTKSCGCLALEVRSANGFARRLHGLRGTPEYAAWCEMITRCENSNRPAWKDYGGRGITICSEWRHSPQKFVDDVGLRPSPTHSIDRIKNHMGYFPGNVRWATRAEQNNNTRASRTVLLNGELMLAKDAAVLLGVKYSTFMYRLNKGIPLTGRDV